MIPEQQMNMIREALALQTEHPVVPKVRVTMRPTDGVIGIWRERYRAFLQGTWEEVIEALETRQGLITAMEADPFRFLWEPEIIREMDLRVARMRREFPGVVLEVLLTGGIRPGKTEYATRRVNANFYYTNNAKVWALHETQTTSKRWQQPRFYRLMPPEAKTDSGKHRKDLRTKFNYSEGGGFTDDMFNVHWTCRDERDREINAGGMTEFRFYGADAGTLQGSELTAATSDELVPRETCDSVRERLLSRAQDTARPEFQERIAEAIRVLEGGGRLPLALLGAVYHSVHIISFTPKEGYSPTVADFMDGAVTLVDMPTLIAPPEALNLPDDFRERYKDQELLPGKRVPVFKQPKKKTRLIVYLPTWANPFKGNWPGMVADLVGKTEDEIRILAYGDVQKNWNVRFAGFNDTVHVLREKERVASGKAGVRSPESGVQSPESGVRSPESEVGGRRAEGGLVFQGTWRELVDPHGGRPWFMAWQLCLPDERLVIFREWPQEGDPIFGVGDPGPWAVSSRTGNKNGDRGSAQGLKLNWGFPEYTREIWRVRFEIGAWFHAGNPEALRMRMEWKERPEWTLEGTPILPVESYMDLRFAHVRTASREGAKTLIQSMSEEEHGIDFLPSPAENLDEGDIRIIDALSYNKARPLDALNQPRLCVWHECAAHVFMFQNYSTPEFSDRTRANDEACKDPRDTTAMGLLIDPVHVPPRRAAAAGEFAGCY